MKALPLEVLELEPMAGDNSRLRLTRVITWAKFASYAESLVRVLGGEVVERADSPDEGAWTAVIHGQRFWINFDDLALGVSLDPCDDEAAARIDGIRAGLVRIKGALGMRRVSFIALVILMALTGVRLAFIPEQDDTGVGALIPSFLTALLIASWAQLDGRARGKPLVTAASVAIFFTFPVAFPVYCLWSRGARGVLFCLGFTAILLVAGTAALLITESVLGVQY